MFFLCVCSTENGCRFGAQCRFLHTAASAGAAEADREADNEARAETNGSKANDAPVDIVQTAMAGQPDFL